MIAGPRQSMYGTAGGEATAGTLSFCRGEFMSTINERIAREVFGWKDIELFYPPCQIGEVPRKPFLRAFRCDGFWAKLPDYDTNPADALAVLKVCAEKTDQVSITQCEGDWAVCEGDGNGDSYPEGEGKTLEAAICNFALKLFSPAAQAFNPDDK